MTFARGSRHGLLFIEEQTFGSAPTSASTAMYELRHTSCGLNASKNALQSAELSSDRNVRDYRLGRQNPSGEIGIEFIYEGFDDLIGGALFNTWTTNASETLSLAASPASSAFYNSNASWTIPATGAFITMSGFTAGTTSNNTTFLVTSWTASTVIVDATLTSYSSTTQVTVARAARITNRTTRPSFTIERCFTDITQYHRFYGSEVNTFNLNMSPDAMVTGSFGIVSATVDTAVTSLASSSSHSAVSNTAMDAYSGALIEGGTANTVVTGITLSISNNINPAAVIGQEAAADMIEGRCNVTGSLSVFFEDSTMIDKFINETSSSLIIKAVDPDSNQYWFYLPLIKYGSFDVPANSEGALVASMDFQALKHTTYGYTILIAKV